MMQSVRRRQAWSLNFRRKGTNGRVERPFCITRLAEAAKDSGFATCQWLEGGACDRNFCRKPTKRLPDGGRSSWCADHHRRCCIRIPAAAR